MASTPDRKPGPLEEDDEIRFVTNPIPPTQAGAFNYNGTGFQLRDATGVFDPRSGVTDANAIHTNVGGEISGIVEKTAPAMADLLVTEDSASSNAKKKVQVCTLLAAEPCNFTGEALFFDDFFGPIIDDQWSTSSSGTGSTVALQRAQGGQILVRAGNAAGRSAELFFGGSTAWNQLSFSPRMRLRGDFNGIAAAIIELELLWTDASNYAWLKASTGGNWFLETANAGTVTSTDTGIALDTAWHIYELRGTASGVTAYIDGVLRATNTTNLPTGTGTCSIYVAATGTGGAKDFLVDAFQYRSPRAT